MIKKSQNEQETLILKYIEQNGSITNSNACDLLGLKPARIRMIFKNMIIKRLIVAVGENRSRKYCLR